MIFLAIFNTQNPFEPHKKVERRTELWEKYVGDPSSLKLNELDEFEKLLEELREYNLRHGKTALAMSEGMMLMGIRYRKMKAKEEEKREGVVF